MKWPVLQLCGQRDHLKTKFHFFFPPIQTAHANLITGELKYFAMESPWTNLETTEDPNMMLHFQMKFSLSLMSSLVKEGTPGTSHTFCQLNMIS